jgi:DUF4097 and DUF4098 domain-containing protein YvlB
VKPRKLALLFLILGFGAAIETAYSLKNRLAIGPAGCRVLTGRFQGPSYSFESEQVREGVPADLVLEVENAFGEVRVWKGEPGRVKLRLRKVVYLPTEEQAGALAGRLQASLQLAGDTLRVTTNRRELEQASEAGFETHLAIEVPPETRVSIQNEHGAASVADAKRAKVASSYDAVRAERIAGAVEIDSRHGDVVAESVGGELNLRSRYGSVDVQNAGPVVLTAAHGDVSVKGVASLKAELSYSDLSVESVQGELEVHGSHAAVKAQGVKGRTQVETSYRNVELRELQGDARVKAEHVAVSASDLSGALHVETTYEDVEATDVGGTVDVSVDHGGFRGTRLLRGARVKTSGDDVELRAFEGPLEIEARRGNVRLVPEKALVDAITATTVRGGIELAVPAGSHFELDASAERGELHLDLPELAVQESSSARVKGRLGQGGKAVTLRSEHGDISVESRTAAVSR